ncbi:YbaK/EbsC family protein [Geomonas sp. RF6]|uniref:YbaK/EbsC family protein n=1 Tax=Geomonas sp. RF6 TaxID=2897342 RepID=UPI001E407E31|nr:YbaK/EbsC family protein [Geomonas sp. RF6]UFS70111.1 YbaK/EbsC family protein [Geomonas sp. RF6]
MEAQLSRSAQRVQDALTALGLSCRVEERSESTRSAEEAAQVVGCDVGQIVKSLLFRGTVSGNPLFVLASGRNRVAEARLAEIAGEPIAKANAAFVREKTGFAIGGVAPLGHPEKLPTVIDEDLLQYQELWAAAGTPAALFRLTPQELSVITDGQIAAIRESA